VLFRSRADKKDLAKVTTKGGGISIQPDSIDKHPDAICITAPMAIMARKGIESTHKNSSERIPRSILGLSSNGITMLVMSEGENVRGDGVTADELTIIAFKLGMDRGVHLSQGWATNTIVTYDDEPPRWVMPSPMYMYEKKPLALIFTEK